MIDARSADRVYGTGTDPVHGLPMGRIPGALEPYWASPVGADGKVYMVSQAGKLSVMKAQGDWEVLKVNDLDDETFATPAIGDNRLYVRTRTTLYAFGLSK